MSMDRFSCPDDLIRAQQEGYATYRALAAPRPRPATQLCRLTGGDRRVEAA
ncbi:hypothetical protein [Streptomyces globisporus]|uniref:hypothetical protein n=1 Tax=Streptomyces globisporus TaxID=1908 RepID=UPI0036A4D3BD